MAEKQFCTFFIGGEMFGIDILSVREINRHLEFTNVNKVADHIKGMLNLRGQIVTILDLGIRLGIGPIEISHSSRSIILKTRKDFGSDSASASAAMITSESDAVGLLVDRVGEVVAIQEKEIEQPPANIGKIEGKFMTGVVKMQGVLLSILDIQTVCD